MTVKEVRTYGNRKPSIRKGQKEVFRNEWRTARGLSHECISEERKLCVCSADVCKEEKEVSKAAGMLAFVVIVAIFLFCLWQAYQLGTVNGLLRCIQ